MTITRKNYVLLLAIVLLLALLCLSKMAKADGTIDLGNPQDPGAGESGWSYVAAPNKTITITASGTYTIKGGANTIVVLNDNIVNPVNVLLINANISVHGSTFCAFDCGTGNSVFFKLSGDSNNLIGGTNYAGVRVPATSSLTIESVDGTDSHVLRGCSGAGSFDDGRGAGIGGNASELSNGEDAGTITIKSGAVYAGSLSGAGIGGGKADGNIGNGGAGGTVMISGGMVTATSFYGAGIGGGASRAGTGGVGGTVTITGGTVNATAGSASRIGFGAAIGGGGGAAGNSIGGAGGVVTISGGTVNAVSIGFGTGIGGGGAEKNSTGGARGGDGGAVTISGGTNRATSTRGCGIGSGVTLDRVTATAGTTTIMGGSLWASGVKGAIQDQPTNGNGNTVYMNMLTMQGATPCSQVLAGSINGVSCAQTPVPANGVYGIHDVWVDDQCNVYFYLPASIEGEPVLLRTADGTYGSSYTREANDNNTATPNRLGITAFSINGINGVIDEAAGTITITMPAGTDITALAPVIAYTAGAALNPASGETKDFSGPQTYTFTMASIGNYTKTYTVTVTETPPQSSGGGYISTTAHTTRTLTDNATGVTVTGQMTSYAHLTVREIVLRAEGTCPACDEIRARQAAGEVILLYDISISGGYTGELEVSIPIGDQYNGQAVTILHCVNGKLESVPCVVRNGVATGMFKRLSPFAVVRDTSVAVPDEVVADPPKTGDVGSAPLGFLLLCIGFAGLVEVNSARKKRHSNHN